MGIINLCVHGLCTRPDKSCVLTTGWVLSETQHKEIEESCYFQEAHICLENKTHLIRRSLEALARAEWDQEFRVGLGNSVSHRWVLLRYATAMYQCD